MNPIYGIVAQDILAPGIPSIPLNTKFVIVGWDTYNLDPLILISDDGTSWSYRNPNIGSGIKLYGIAHDPIGDRWVAVGDGGSAVVFYSDDKGDTWTQVDPGQGAGSRSFGICWTGTRFIAVGKYSSLPLVMVSTDGISWTAKTPAPNTAGQLMRCVGVSGLALAGGIGGTTPRIMSSANDGDTWTSRTPASATSTTVDDFAIKTAGGTVIAAVAEGAGSTATRVTSSTDGTTWTARTSDPANGIYWRGAVWNGSVFCAVGADSSTGSVPHVMTSSNGTTWTAKTPAPASDFFPISVGAASDGAMVACGDESGLQDPRMMLSSDNGVTWTQVFPPSIEIEPGNPGAFWMNLQHVAGA